MQAVAVLVSLFVCYDVWVSLWRPRAGWLEADTHSLGSSVKKEHLACRSLPGANETLVVLKTGATELEAKVLVHLSTTLQCYPHRLLFSDTAEALKDQPIIDALESVSSHVRENHPDFELYRWLRDHGRGVLASDEILGMVNETGDESWTGHAENPGWKLDKWKFLPMVNRTLHEYPEMKWYVFIEADTYILWASLLEYLATLDHSKPYYAGVKVFIGEVGFAHGGSGFIVSQPAMRLVVDHFNTHQRELEEFTDGHWAGDCVLGKAFTDADVQLTDAWPIMQGDYPGIVPYVTPDGRPMPFTDERIWCNPTISYHHMEPAMVEDLWQFEQQWLLHVKEVRGQVLGHDDLVLTQRAGIRKTLATQRHFPPVHYAAHKRAST